MYIPEFHLYQAQTGLFSEVAAYDVTGPGFNLTGDHPEQLHGLHVTEGYFRLFGAPVVLGRTFTLQEDLPHGGRVAVLSYGLWQRKFGGDPSILGKTLSLGNDPYTIIGVLGKQFLSDPQAQDVLDIGKKELALQAIPAMDVTKAEAEVAAREQNLTIARTTLELLESLLKNALTKNLDDPLLEAMRVVPTEPVQVDVNAASQPLSQLIDQAPRDRPELGLSEIDLRNRDISRRAAANAVLPTISLNGYYGGTGLAGQKNPVSSQITSVPTGYSSSVGRAFDNSSPDYLIGLQINIPLRNRVAKSDQYRSELEYRQSQLRIQQLKKQIRIEVRNAQYALEQSAARVKGARTSRDLAQRILEVSQKEQKLGAGSSFQTLAAQRDLAFTESTLATSLTAYEKARVEVDRAIGATLETNNISVDAARYGSVAENP